MSAKSFLLIWSVFNSWQGGVVDEISIAYKIGRMAGLIFSVLAIIIIIFTLSRKSRK